MSGLGFLLGTLLGVIAPLLLIWRNWRAWQARGEASLFELEPEQDQQIARAGREVLQYSVTGKDGVKLFVREIVKDVERGAQAARPQRWWERLARRLLGTTGLVLLELMRIRRQEGPRRQPEQRAAGVLRIWSLLLPARIAKEEIGDYLEEINEMAANQAPAWQIYLRLAAACFWTGWHAIKDLPLKALAGGGCG